MKKHQILMIKWLSRKPVNSDQVRFYLEESFEKNWFTNFGPASRKLEQRIHELLDISDDKAVIVTSNGSHALHAIVSAISMERGKKKYAVPGYTFPTNIQGNLEDSIVVNVGPDMGLDLYDLDFEVEAGAQIDGIIVTNVFGYLQDLDKYVDWANANNKILIFDNAATPASYYKGVNAVNYGFASIISFHHTKPLGFGEGGAIVIDKEYEPIIRRAINFGFDADRKPHRFANNYKMSDISAAYILQHLDNYHDIRAHHAKLYDMFIRKLNGIEGVRPMVDHGDNSMVAGLIAVFDKPVSVQDAVLLCDNKIDIKKYYDPIGSEADCINAYNLYDRILIYPCHMQVSETDIDMIVQNIKDVLHEIN